MRTIFVYFFCVSFLLLTSGFNAMVAEANEIGRPVGEMISRGEVKFEVRQNVWKDVEPPPFPIFQGVRIKTDKGACMITLKNNGQIEVGQNSLFSFDRDDQIHLYQGTISFRVPSTAELNFRVGDLTVGKYRSFQASQNPSASSQVSEETIGSLSVHPNGSVTVKSVRGSLSVVNQDHVVLPAISSKDTVTIPSVAAKSSSKVMVAQAGETTSTPSGSEGQNLLHTRTPSPAEPRAIPSFPSWSQEEESSFHEHHERCTWHHRPRAGWDYWRHRCVRR